MSLPTIPRRTLLAALAAGGGAALMGCNPAAQQQQPATSDGGVVGKSEVTVYAWSNGPIIDNNFKKRVELFNQEFAGKFKAKINFLPYEQYWQKVQLQYSAQQPFDIYFWDVQAYAHFKKNLIIDNQAVIEQSGMLDAQAYPANLYEPWKFDGTNLYCIPENIQTIAFFYNTDHFDEAGIAYPDGTWDWDKALEVGRELKRSNGDKVTRWGLDVGVLDVWWGLQYLSWSAGSSFADKVNEPTAFTLEDPRNIEAMRFVQQAMWAPDNVSPNPTQRSTQDEGAGGFAGGGTSMTVAGTWNIATYQEMKSNWAMAPLPKWQGQNITPYFLGGWVIPKKSAAMTAAQTFATWSATTFQSQMAKNHDWIPLQNAARTSKDMIDGMPEGFSAAMEAIPNARIGDIYTLNMQQIFNEVFGPAIQELINNRATPEATAARMQSEATALLA